MSIEPGQRLSRRELRERELAAQAEGSGDAQANPDPPAPPPGPTTAPPASTEAPGAVSAPSTADLSGLTRRELRELEASRAAAAEQPAGAPPTAAPQQTAPSQAAPQQVAPSQAAPQQVAPSQAAPTQAAPSVEATRPVWPSEQVPERPKRAQPPAGAPQPRPSQQPPSFADQPTPPPSSASPFVSRRELREAEPVAPPPPGAPVRQTAVRPPTSGAIRGLDAQGGLGEVRPAAGGVASPTDPGTREAPAGSGQAAAGRERSQHSAPSAPEVGAHPGRPAAPAHVPSPGGAPTQVLQQPVPAQPHPPSTTAARPQAPGARPERGSPVAPGVPVPPIARTAQSAVAMPAPVAPFVPARPDDPAGAPAQTPTPTPTWGGGTFTAPQPGQAPFSPQPQRSPAPSPESGWTPAVSGAVRAPVEPGTLPPGVIAPVTQAPPAGTFVPTGSMPIVQPGAFPGATVQRAPVAPSAPGVAAPGWEASEDGAPAWGSLGISTQEVEEDEETHHRGYTWLHMVVLSVVAFVAGLLVWLLFIQGRGTGAPEGTVESAAGSVGAISAVVQHPPGVL